ncbi:MAG: hypothetical protein J5819_03190 [Eubacterium sp.]|nr:hypothetical protein [Eubacterium sp.]
MNKSDKREVFNGGSMSPFWDHDHFNPYHNQFSVELDHEIDPELLAQAWNKTKEVYPLIDWVPERVGGDVVFYEDDLKNPPIHSAVSVIPGGELTAGRTFSLTYDKNRVTMNAFHSIVDGGGISSIFSTMLYFYLSLYTGVRDDEPLVMTRTGRKPEEYFVPMSSVNMRDFTPVPLVSYAKRDGMFIDEELAPDDEGRIERACLKTPVQPFMDFCKKHGANPSSMLVYLLAKVIYDLYPDRTGDIAFVLTMSVRKFFNAPESIANCSANLLIPVRHDDITDDEQISKAIKNIRSVISYQQSEDYIKTLTAFYDTYDWILAKRYAFVTYMGKFNVGSQTSHVRSFRMTDDATSSLYMMDLNGEFVISFQFGRATGKYMQGLREVLTGYGLTAEVLTEPEIVLPDAEKPQI